MTKPEFPESEIPSSAGRTITVQRTIRIGLLPNPVELAQYGQIVSDGAERIMRLAESQMAHQQAQERAFLGAEIAGSEAAIQLRRRGQSFAFAIGLATLAASLAAALSGHDSVAVALAVGSLVGVMAAFLGPRIAALGSRRRESS